MLRAYKYRLNPTDVQTTHLNQIFGSVRFVYNLAIEAKQAAYIGGKNVSCFDLCKQLTDLKQELPWLYDSPNHALQGAINNLDNAYTNFFKGRAKFPSFKKRNGRQSFHIPQGIKADFENGLVFIPKLKWVSVFFSRYFKGTIRNATVSRTPTGKYFVSILVETGSPTPEKAPIERSTAIGIDVGLMHFATLSDGTKIDNPRFLKKSIRRLRVEQRTMQRRFKSGRGYENQSNGYKKQKIKVALLHEKVANQRKDFLHKQSTSIAKRFDTVVMENLNIAGMVQNKNLARSIQDAGWSMFGEMLKYKCDWYGKNFHQIGRFEPSSKICSCCGKHKGTMKMSERVWACAGCGATHDRDINAAINIKNFGTTKNNGQGLVQKTQTQRISAYVVLESPV